MLQPPPLPRSAKTGTPAPLRASMSRWMVRSETSRRFANSAAVMRRWTCKSSMMETSRSALISRPQIGLLQGRGHVLVDDQPLPTALFPDRRVTNIQLHGFTVLHLRRQMTGYGGPDDIPAPVDLKIVFRRQGAARHCIEKVLLHTDFVFIPAVIFQRGDVV